MRVVTCATLRLHGITTCKTSLRGHHYDHQEADAEEEGEAQRLAEWDKGAADEAYKAEIERAQAYQQELDDQAAAYVRTSHASSPPLDSATRHLVCQVT